MKKFAKEVFNINIECFASPINCHSTNYCSLFESDKKFGSSGNFFEYFPKTNIPYLHVNPPYTDFMINESLRIVIEKIDKAN